MLLYPAHGQLHGQSIELIEPSPEYLPCLPPLALAQAQHNCRQPWEDYRKHEEKHEASEYDSSNNFYNEAHKAKCTSATTFAGKAESVNATDRVNATNRFRRMPELSGPRTKFGEKLKGVCCVHECAEALQEKHEENVSGKGWSVDAH